MRRRLLTPLALTVLCTGAGSSYAAPAIPATRILYASDWSGPRQVFAADPSGRRPVGQLTFGPAPACRERPGVECGFAAPEPSPDGRRVLFWDSHYGARTAALYVSSADGRNRTVVARDVPWNQLELPEADWSPDSKRVAYVASRSTLSSEWHVVGADGKRDRATSMPAWVRLPGQSPDQRWVATVRPKDLLLWDTRRAAGRTFLIRSSEFAWSSDSRHLAVATDGGIIRVEASSGRQRRLTAHEGGDLAWSPDNRSIAFVKKGGSARDNGDLRIVTVAGRVRTLIDAAGDQGGFITGLSWVRPPSDTTYRTASDRFPAARGGLVARSPVDRLAADGDRVAFASCNHVFVWTPRSGDVRQAEPVASLAPRCSGGGNYLPLWTYDLALSGNRVAWAELSGNAGRTASLRLTILGSDVETVTPDVSYGVGGPYAWRGIGELEGSEGDLVFSSWVERYVGGQCCTIVTIEQSLRRIEPRGCPCPALRTEPGPFVPFDVDGGRIVAGGDNAVVLVDSTGSELLALPVRAEAALLAGRDLVVLVRGGLRHYDVGTGALIDAWPLADVPSGQTCGTPNMSRCQSTTLRLEDLAQGLAAYVLDGNVHVLRLVDGVDVVVGPGSHARFLDSGLVYADGPRLRLVSFDQLPLR